jgi:RNA polymerase primary sigma factor
MRQFKITEKITGRESEAFKAYLRDVSRIDQFPTPEAEAECAKKAFDGDEDAIAELVNRNLRFVISVAKHYHNGGTSLEDLVNEGNCGLLEAARRFDPTAGNKFISYAVWYIRKDIMQYLTKSSRQVKLPVNKINKMTDFNNKINALQQELGREVDIEDLLENIEGYTPTSIIDMFEIKNTSTTSMDAPFKTEEGAGNTLHDILESDDYLPTDHLVANDTNHDTLEFVLSTLDERAKKIIKLYFGFDDGKPMNLNEIGDEVGLSREGVRLIKDKSLRILRVRARKLGIKETMF